MHLEATIKHNTLSIHMYNSYIYIYNIYYIEGLNIGEILLLKLQHGNRVRCLLKCAHIIYNYKNVMNAPYTHGSFRKYKSMMKSIHSPVVQY